MFYILDELSYIEEVSTHYIERDNKTCTEYTGAIPEGYETLDDWVLNANIRAYKIVSNNLIYDADRAAALENEWKNAGSFIYPVGSIYMSVNPTNPEYFFGGKWEQLKDMFLLGAGDTYEAGTTGGSATHNHGLASGYAHINSSGKTIIYQYKSGESWKANYQVTGSSGASSSTSYSDVTTLGGTTDAGSSLPPYLTVYIWKRIE
jgi:hypothetical protein